LLKYAAAALLAALHIINVDETDWAHRSQFGARVFCQRGAQKTNILASSTAAAAVVFPKQKARLLTQ
jgi:hypothetical protein